MISPDGWGSSCHNRVMCVMQSPPSAGSPHSTHNPAFASAAMNRRGSIPTAVMAVAGLCRFSKILMVYSG